MPFKGAQRSVNSINMLIGNCIGCYIGYATDCEIRYNASSGGLVTQLLLYALESEIINGALVTKMRKDDPLKPEPFIARTKKEIIEAMGSKYCPVPIGLLLRDILRAEENEKLAVVGLPCHIRSIIKAEQINEKLRKKIALHIGLFCNHTPDFSATESFLHRIKVKKEDITELRYRGSGWPGFMKISLKNGRTIKVALPLYWKFLGLDFFIPRSCLLCNDGLNELADLSFGDAWLPSVLSKDNMGASIVVVRSITGENIIQGARKYGKVKLTKISPEEVVKSQLSNIYFKKVILKSRAKFLGMSFSNNIIETGVLDSIYALFCILNSQFLSKSIFFKFILKKAPMKIINSYYLFPNFLYSKMLNNFRKKLLIDV